MPNRQDGIVHPISRSRVLQRQKVIKRGRSGFHIRRTPSPLLIPALILLLIASILCYVWTRIQAVQYGYEISAALRAKEDAIIARNERTIELATLRSAQQVEKRAREELGMSPPRKDQLFIMR